MAFRYVEVREVLRWSTDGFTFQYGDLPLRYGIFYVVVRVLGMSLDI